MVKSRVDIELRREVGLKVKACLKQRGWSQSRAANALGINRTALNRALNGKATPSGETLSRMCQVLGVRFNIGGKELGATDFQQSVLASAPAKQYRLALDECVLIETENGQLEVTVQRTQVDGRIELRLTLKESA